MLQQLIANDVFHVEMWMEEGDVEKLIGWGLDLLNKVNYRDRYELCGEK